MKTLQDVFTHTLKDMFYAETAITKALPKVIAEVSNPKMKKALQHHLEETKGQIERLTKVFKTIGEKAAGEKCDAIEGLIKECEGVMKDTESSGAKHAGIAGCLQAIEHYEIARYGTLREWAKLLGNDEAHDLLTQNLDEEKAANHGISHLAVTEINEAAGTNGSKKSKAAA